MTPITLKSYQQAALDSLAALARAAQLQGPALARVTFKHIPYDVRAR